MTANLGDLLDALGHHDGERVSICHQIPGEAFVASVVPINKATAAVASHADNADVWWGVNPTNTTTGRGDVDSVTRWAALYADLDVKTGGMPTITAAHAVVEELSALLGVRPVALTFSGHGLQPYWALDPEDEATDLTDPQRRTAAQATLRRFGRLVAAVAERFDGAVDNVYDLARVLRAPATVNRKADPVPVVTAMHDGAPMTVDRLTDALDAYGVPAFADDGETLGEQLSNPNTWTWAANTCAYTKSMIAGWNTDQPTARHPWLVSNAIRLAAAKRLGCITADDHRRALRTLNVRMTVLVESSNPPRKLSPGELNDAHAWATAKVATMPEDRARRELGDHPHGDNTSTLNAFQPPTTDGALATVTELAQHRPDPALHVIEESTLDHSDDGNSLRLIDRFGHLIRHIGKHNIWLAWDGHHWQWCDRNGGVVREHAKRVARALPTDNATAIKHKKYSLGSGGISAMLAQAATDARVAVTPQELDAHPTLLNTPSGIVDLATARIGPNDPEQLHTRATKVAPDFEMATPRWDEFLADTFEGHEELIPYVRRLLGYSATGLVTHHTLPFLLGPGGNGKSVLMDVSRALLGDYASTAPAKFLMVGQQQHETEIARLSGLRMVICSEINQSDKFDEAKVKDLTGGDALTARFMRGDHFTFAPTHKLWLMGNHQPTVSAGGASFWRRLRVLEFANIVSEDKLIDGLAEKLVDEEGPGILAWIVGGAREVLADGLQTPAGVMAATRQYAAEEDHLGRFLTDACHIGGGKYVRTNTKDVRSAYEQWCREEGEDPLNATKFGREIKRSHHIVQERSHGQRYYLNLTLLNPENVSPADDWRNK